MDEEDTGSNGSRSPYQYIADVLRGEIFGGHYPVGQRIPSQGELEKRFQVSRPTIQRALGILRDDGLLDNQRGRPSEVLPWTERAGVTQAEVPETATPALRAVIAEAFEERTVSIDAYSLTAETLNRALTGPLLRVQNGELRPDSIRLRLLLPSPDARLAIPRLVGDPSDDRPLWRLRQLMRAHVVTLRAAFTAVAELAPGIEQSVEVRTVPITPMQKLYLFNGHTAVSGYYQVVRREVDFETRGKGTIYDVLGLSAVLFPHHHDPADPDAYDSRFVAESYAWFDSLWSTIAEPLTLLK